MKHQDITVALNEGMKLVPAYVSPTFPGIAIHRSMDASHWAVTHILSGYCISSSFRMRRIAAEFAKAVSRLVKFSKPLEQINHHMASRPKLRLKLRDLAAKFKRQ